jgi:D-3-phosphoglycerate dehydrogenase / 2-oxoglutarate reductase
MYALLTDSDRFPFAPDEAESLAAAGLELAELQGHDQAALVEAGRGALAIFVYHAQLRSQEIEQLKACRVLVRCGTGYDNIDVRAARARGIEVTHVPAFGTGDVADHTLALLLACARKLIFVDRALRIGEWPTWRELTPLHRLRDRVLGIVGAGRIGSEVATRAHALGMTVVAYDPYRPAAVAQIDSTVGSLEELLERSDIVSLHVPLTPETHGLIGRRELSLMRQGAILINTSRGQLIDEPALIEALEMGHLAAVGLDVYAVEPIEPNNRLLGLENVVITPHSAAFTEEALKEVRSHAIEEALRAVSGKPPLDPVPA